MSQLSKEEYDQAMESSNFDPSQPFAKASKEVLSRRKIFKATRCVCVFVDIYDCYFYNFSILKMIPCTILLSQEV